MPCIVYNNGHAFDNLLIVFEPPESIYDGRPRCLFIAKVNDVLLQNTKVLAQIFLEFVSVVDGTFQILRFKACRFVLVDTDSQRKCSVTSPTYR